MDNTYYIETLEKIKKQTEKFYTEKSIELFNKVFSKEELISMPKDEIRDITIKMEVAYDLHCSPIDTEKLAYSIQCSRISLVGGRAVTNFKCKLCGREENWSTTATPDICSKCAKNMAERMAVSTIKIFKK